MYRMRRGVMAALYARFRFARGTSFADRLWSARGSRFGGHKEFSPGGSKSIF